MPKLVRDVIRHFEIALSQLMPNSWRILMSLECLSMRSGIVCGLGEVLYSYFLREHDLEKGHYLLYMRLDRVQLVSHLKTNDHGWKQSYFFAQGSLMFGLFLLVLVHVI